MKILTSNGLKFNLYFYDMMSYISHILIGFGMSYLGFLPPGMLNMTAVREAMEHNIFRALKFSLGASTTVAIQAFIALFFAQKLQENPSILDYLEYVAIPIFLALAIFFFTQSKLQQQKKLTPTTRPPFVAGLSMAVLNTIAIPFFFGYCTLFLQKGWILFDGSHKIAIILGAFIGSFSLFASYSYLASYIARKMTVIAKNINLILAILFATLGSIMLIKLFF